MGCKICDGRKVGLDAIPVPLLRYALIRRAVEQVGVIVLALLLVFQPDGTAGKYGVVLTSLLFPSDELLDKVVSSFAELRQLSDEGLISYPYSTREAVNIVKHLQVGDLWDVLV